MNIFKKSAFTILTIFLFLNLSRCSSHSTNVNNFTPAPSPGTPGTTRDAAIWPFSSDSPWNMPLARAATYTDKNDPCTQDLIAFPPAINAEKWSHPVYIASNSPPNADPETSIFVGIVLQITTPIPLNATPADPPFTNGDCTTIDVTQGDAHLHIIDPTHHFVDEMWRAAKEGDHLKACGYQRNDLYSSGIEKGGTRAYGGSALGGLIRKGELKNGIFHPLAFTIPRSKQKCCSPVWPATEIDDQRTNPYQPGNNIPMGQLIALPPDLNLEILNLSPQAKIIARALQDYGAYDVDSAGINEIGFSVETSASGEVDNNLETDLKKVVSELRCVTNNRKDNIGGGAVKMDTPRRAPLAPPLK